MTKHGGNLKELAEKGGLKVEEIIDFSASINPLGPPEYFRSVVSRNLSAVVHYPDPDYSALISKISSLYNIGNEQIVIGNGTSELIFLLPRVLPVSRAVIPVPSYVDYHTACELANLEISSVELLEDNGFKLDCAELAKVLTGGELVFLGQPNNPTGTMVDRSKLLDLVRSKSQTYFVVDEAFADFVGDYSSLILEAGKLPANLIIIKSLTKFYAIPGLRLGIAVAAEKNAAIIRKNLPPWSVNGIALAVGEKMIVDRLYQEKTRETVSRLRKALSEKLGKFKELKVFDAAANYILVKVIARLDAEIIRDRLLEKGVAIRLCDNFKGLGKEYFRVAVNTEAENNLLCDLLAEIGLTEIDGGDKVSEITKTSQATPRRRPPYKIAGKGPSLMFQGVGSDAGKSVLTAGLCRVLLQDGVRVAPFKAQNMSLNSFVTWDGGEMGRAQVVQAQACRLDPDTRMNPVLLKPSSEVGSQVIVNGKPVANMSVEEYFAYKPEAFKAVKLAYDSLAADYDAVILEGAGSPAEVNLKGHDIVNMNMARYAQSPVLLIGDIDRGGVFASFVGTMEVMSEWERRLVAGFVVNRFRGRESLLQDALDYTLAHTGKPVVGVIPYLSNLGLPEEDSVSFKKGNFGRQTKMAEGIEIALIDLPHISNFTDFEPFLAEPDVFLNIVRSPADLGTPDAVIIPGSKNVINDLKFLQESGLVKKITDLAGLAKTEIIGVCGGFQILGKEIADPHGIEASGQVVGLGLLDLQTVLEQKKTLTRQIMVHHRSGQKVYGYEIHHGQTPSRERPIFTQGDGQQSGAESSDGMIWGTYLHGLFDSDSFRHWFVENLRSRRGLAKYQEIRPLYDLEPALDRLADLLRARLDMKYVYQLLGL